MDTHVLIVDDEADLLMSLEYALSREGYRTTTAESGRSALAKVAGSRPDLVILDLQLPDLSGIEVCRRMKADPETAGIPVLMLTAKGEEADRVQGLEVGAEDYVVKPFSMREFALRVRAVLRRSADSGEVSGTEKIEFGTLVVDVDAHSAMLSGTEMDLTALEFKLLLTFLERRGRVQTRETLLRDVWEYEGQVMTRTVDTNVKRLRQKLAEGGDWIETIRGVGYRFSVKP